MTNEPAVPSAEASVWIDATPEVVWRTDCAITHCTKPEQFRFGVATEVEGKFSTSWLYTLTPEDGGTRVSESFESPYLLAASPEMSMVRPKMLEDMLESTLASIKSEVEAAD